MESGGEAMDDHGPGWVPVKKKHRSGSKFSVQSWAGGFSGKNGSSYKLPISSVSVKFANLAGKQRPQLSKGGAKHSAPVPNEDDNAKGSSEKPPTLEQNKDNESPPKLLDSSLVQNSAVPDNNLEVLPKDGTEMVLGIKWGDFDDGDISVLYPGNMHEGNVKSSDSENSSLVVLNNETINQLTSPSFSCTDFQENKSGFAAVTTNICSEQLISSANEEEKNAENSDKLSIISQHASDNVSESGETHGETCEPVDNCLDIAPPSCKKTGMGVDGSGIQEVPEISEVSAPSLSGCLSFPTRKNDFGISGEGRIQFKPEPSEEIASELSTSPIEKLGVVIECQSPFVLEGNKPTFSDSSMTIEESGMVVQLQLPVPPTSEEKELEVSASLVEESGVEVECQSVVVSEGNKLEVSESLVTLQESGTSRVSEPPIANEKLGIVVDRKLPLISERNESIISEPVLATGKSVFVVEAQLTPFSEVDESRISVSPVRVVEPQLHRMSKGNELRVPQSLGTIEKLGVVVEHQVPDKYELRAESPVIVTKTGIVVESPLPLISKEADSIVSELFVTVEKSATAVESSSPLVSEEIELRVSESPVIMEKAALPVESQFPFVSEKNNLRVSEASVAIGKADVLAEAELPLISEEKEFRVSESPVTVEKSGTVVDPSLLLSFKENESRVSDVPATIEKADMVVESRLPLTSYKNALKDSVSSVTIEKSEPLVESQLPLFSKENELRASDFPLRSEKSDTLFGSQLPLISEEQESRASESPAFIQKSDMVDESQLPMISKENEFTCSRSPVTMEKFDIFVESHVPLISKDNESRALESLVTIEFSEAVAGSQLPLMPEENELSISKSLVSFEKSDILVKSQIPPISRENDLRAPERPFIIDKSDMIVDSELPSVSKENEFRVSGSSATVKKLNTEVKSQLPPISKEDKSRVFESDFTIDNSDRVAESLLPFTSKENEFRVSGSSATVRKLNTEDKSLLPPISKEDKSRVFESDFTIDKSDRVAESQLPFTSKENECTASELPVIVTKSATSVESSSPVCSQEDESGVSEAQKSGMVVKVQTRLSLGNEYSRVSWTPVEKSDMVVEPQLLPIICEENESKASNFPFRSERSGTMIEPQSHPLPLAYEGDELRYPDRLPRTEKSNTLATHTETASALVQRCVSEVCSEYSTVVKLNLPATSESNELSVSEFSIIKKFPSAEVLLLDSKSVTSGNIGHEISLCSSQTTSVGNKEGSIYTPVCDDLRKIHNQSDLSEGDAGESKERFRERLWCFLFENLNRSVDELYLLCELECDLDQMKEAVLVLEEAASDFNELTARVQEFDKVKRSSQSVEGALSTLRTDHRRPHALSWEVRRMTTSPHRADILSSSLEAFKKIQQERADLLAANTSENLVFGGSSHHVAANDLQKSTGESLKESHAADSVMRVEQESRCLDGKKQNGESGSCSKVNFIQNGDDHVKSFSGVKSPQVIRKAISTTSEARKAQRVHEVEKVEPNDQPKKQTHSSEKDKEKRNSGTFKSMDAWKEKRNWAEILSSPGMNNRKSAERTRILHDKLMSPEKKKKNAIDLKKEAEEKHARARRIRNELENERVQKLQRTSEKLNRVNEWQAIRTMKLREGMHARHQRGESRHEAYLAQVARRAGDESSKVNEVRFITSLNEENKKLMLRQKLHDSELRRAEKLQVKKSKQKEDMAREEAVLERRKLIEAEKLQRLADTQRRKEEAQVRREEERKASSAAREARAMEQLRKREERAKAQQEEAEMLAQKLAERLKESEQRRKFYLEQIRERASMDFRDQSSPLLRRSFSRDGQGRSSAATNSGEDGQEHDRPSGPGSSSVLAPGNTTQQNSLKRQIKRIRQRLMALKYEFIEPSIGCENSSFGYRTAVGTARAKIGRWIQELQRLRQARKEGASSLGLTTADMIKFIEGREPELQASRQAGLLDFIASALPASHTSKPDACQVTVHLVKLLRVVLSTPANRSYFLAQNLLPPIVPMLSAALENYIKSAASSNVPGCAIISSSRASVENIGSASEVLDNFLWIVGAIIGHNAGSDEREIQMQDGLVELLTAYQVIHRFRDLFALYDRPQVEVLPFPSSILLGVHLLVVLTYKARINSSIDWESSPIEIMLDIGNQQGKFTETSNFRSNSSNGMSGYDYPLSRLQGNTVAPPAVDKSCDIAKNDDPLSVAEDGETNQTHGSVDFNESIVKLTSIPRETDIIEKVVKQLDTVGAEQKTNNLRSLKQPAADLLSAISETGLVSLPSLLTSVLLQTSNRPFSEQGSYILPSNFEEVATGVLKVLNNLALVDISFIQRMLAMPDLKMEFFHLLSFLLSHCTSKWRGATDQIGLLLLESLLLLGYFALFHPENQAVLRWGKSPTILHKVCDLPFAFFSDPELMPVLAGTLVAACYGCEQNRSVVQQELCVDMLLSLLKSCSGKPNPTTDNHPPVEDCSESSHHEFKRSPGDNNPLKSSRNQVVRPSRYSLGGRSSVVSTSSIRTGKLRNQRDLLRAGKSGEEMGFKQPSFGAPPEASTMLHCRFSTAFINKAEEFFSSENGNV